MAEVIEGIFDFDFNAKKAKESILSLVADLKRLEKELKDTNKTAEELEKTEKDAAKVRATLSRAISTEAKSVEGLTRKKKALLAIEKALPGATKLVTAAQSQLLQTERKLTKETTKLTKASKAKSGAFSASAAVLSGGALAVGAVASISVVAGKELFALSTEMEVLGKKAETVFGEALPLVTKQAKENANAAGITAGAYTDQAAAIADLLIPLGFERTAGADYSTQLLNRSAALAEWTGGQISAAEVSKVLGKSLLGERDGLKALGISISDADIKLRLLSKGQQKLTGDALAQAKATATLELILEKSTDAQTAYNNNADTLLRKQALISAQFQEVKEVLATALTPAFKEAADIVVPFVDVLGEAIGIVSRGEESLAGYSDEVKDAVYWIRELTDGGSFILDNVFIPTYELLRDLIVPTFRLFTNTLAALGIVTKESGDEVGVFRTILTATSAPIRAVIGYIQFFRTAFFEYFIPAIGAGVKIVERLVGVNAALINSLSQLTGGLIPEVTPPNFEKIIGIFDLSGKKAGEAFADAAADEISGADIAPPPVAGTTKGAAVDPAAIKAAEAAAKNRAKIREREAKAAAKAAKKEADDALQRVQKLDDDLADLREKNRLESLSEKQRETEETVAAFAELRRRVIEAKGAEAAELAELEELKGEALLEIENKYNERRATFAANAAKERAAAAIEAEVATVEAEGLLRLAEVTNIQNKQLEAAAELSAKERATKVADIDKNAAEVRAKLETETARRIAEIRLREAVAVAEETGTAEAAKTVAALRLKLAELDRPEVEVGVKANDGDIDTLGEKLKEIAERSVVLFGDVANAVGAVFDTQKAKAEEAVARQENALDEIRNNSEDYNAEQLEIEKKRLEEAQALEERAVEKQKRLAAAQLLVNTLVTISKAAAAGGIAAPFTIAAALAALVGGFAKARAAASSAFFDGTDFVDPSGKYGPGRDMVPARLHRGEGVLQTDKNKEYSTTFKAMRRGEVPAELLNGITAAYKSGGLPSVADALASSPRVAPVAPYLSGGHFVGFDNTATLVARLRAIEDAVAALPDAMPKTKVEANADGIFRLITTKAKRAKATAKRAK